MLSSSIALSKTDQSTIDQLSDVAGPLRPGEIFAPYVSAYPLPSGTQYVLARTWQDLSVARAGCVRTLSLLIPELVWTSTEDVLSLFALLDLDSAPVEAGPVSLDGTLPRPLRPVAEFRAKELMEAMFLEESKPVVLFDAADPELIALRLLTALWPSLRARFAVSTFALSPRKIEGRFFDLVFAPKDAKARFSDWPGRRIDGQATSDVRHRWTGTIFERVFQDPFPKLMTDRQLGLIGAQDDDTSSALRIALLWEELHDKVNRVPTAALGLLDIATSRMSANPHVALELAPLLRDATQRAVSTLGAREAWEFIGALVRKVQGIYPKREMSFLVDAVERHATANPDGAIELLEQIDHAEAADTLLPAVASGFAENFNLAEVALANATPILLAKLVSASWEFAEKLAQSPSLLGQISLALASLSSTDCDQLSTALLPHLLRDEQALIAGQLISQLDEGRLASEVRHLAAVSDFRAHAFFEPLRARAIELGSIGQLRGVILDCAATLNRDAFLVATIHPNLDDVRWLLSEPRITVETAGRYLLQLLRRVSDSERSILLSADGVLSRIPDDGVDQLLWAVTHVSVAIDPFLATVDRLIPNVDVETRRALARIALGRCLAIHIGGNEIQTIRIFLDLLGADVDAPWTARVGLSKSVSATVISRNLVAIDGANTPARSQFVAHISAIAESLTSRYSLEMSHDGALACANLMYAAQGHNASGALAAAGQLLPTLFRSRRIPLSALVAATFPVVYRELALKEDVPDLLRFVPFLDWDKCKAARRELVDAFMSAPSWAPEDLAWTACQCRDVERIIGRACRSYGGSQYVETILSRIGNLPSDCRAAVFKAARAISGGSSASP